METEAQRGQVTCPGPSSPTHQAFPTLQGKQDPSPYTVPGYLLLMETCLPIFRKGFYVKVFACTGLNACSQPCKVGLILIPILQVKQVPRV